MDYYFLSWEICPVFDEVGAKAFFGKRQQVFRPGSKPTVQAAGSAGRLETRESRQVPHKFEYRRNEDD
jgi:hypothetical protein